MERNNLFLMSNKRISNIAIVLDKSNDEVDKLNDNMSDETFNDLKYYKKYFNDTELLEIGKLDLKTIKLNEIITFTNTKLYLDDTIYMVCYKIIRIFQLPNLIDELYLFTQQGVNLDNVNLEDLKN